MEINKNNWFARYYNWVLWEYPNDICTFFWTSVFIIGLFPFIVPGRLITNSWEVSKSFGSGLLFWLIYFLMVAVGNGVIDSFGYEFVGFWGIFGLGLLFGLLVILVGSVVTFGPIIGGFYIAQKTGESLTYNKIKENTSSFVGAIRKKHCTKITWK